MYCLFLGKKKRSEPIKSKKETHNRNFRSGKILNMEREYFQINQSFMETNFVRKKFGMCNTLYMKIHDTPFSFLCTKVPLIILARELVMASTDKNNNNGTPSMFMNNAMIMHKKKKTAQGRKKIEIKKIDNVSNRQVTFSKRRAGLFKKAGELCILTGAEVAIIVQSSGKRVYAFGHPSVDGVIDKYLAGTSSSSAMAESLAPSSSSKTSATTTTLSSAEMHEHNLEYNRLRQELDVEKKKLQEKEKFVNSGGNFWWDEPIDHLGLEELEQYMAALEELRKNVLTRADELALSKNSHPAMNNVDVNHTMTTTVGASGYPSSMIPYSNSDNYQFGNQ